MTGNVRRAGVVLAILGLLALPACNGESDDQPRTLPPVTSSPTASALPGPTMLPAAKQHTREGADAFTRHYIAVLNHAYGTGETEALQALSGESCKSCAGFIRTVQDVYRDGRIEGGQLTIRDTVTPPFGPGTIPATQVDASQARQEDLDRNGNVIKTTEPVSSARLLFYLEWSEPAWRVSKINLGSQQ